MSSEQARQRRLQRLKDDYRVINARKEAVQQLSAYVDMSQPHRWKKHNPFNCGNVGCPFCANPRRINKGKTSSEKTLQEIKFLQEEYDFGDD